MKKTTTFQPNSPIIPVLFCVKFNPPSIGLIYKRKETDKKMRRYEIFLNDLIRLQNPELITQQLFIEHSLILNPNLISFNQV